MCELVHLGVCSPVVPSMRTKGSATDVCHSCGDFMIRLLSVSRILLF